MMNKVLRIDEKLRYLAKPCSEKISNIDISDDCLFITCAGFEDRSVESLKRISAINNNQVHVVIFDYLPFYKQNRLAEMVQTCNVSNMTFNTIIYDRENPAAVYANLNMLLKNEIKKIYIDISGMSRLLIIQLLVSCFIEKRSFAGVTIIYTEAREYPPTKESVERQYLDNIEGLSRTAMFISSGVFDVAIVPELASIVMQGQPLRLIMFPSFNCQQLVALQSVIQPHFFTFIHGVPLSEENHWRTDAIKQLNHIEKITSKEEYDLSTFYYAETLDILLDIYDQHNKEEKIVIAPTGSKMQSVAVGIFRAFMEDVQIVYPTPVSFNDPEKYTLGVQQMYKLNLDAFNVLSKNPSE
jgi:hypothetical protein